MKKINKKDIRRFASGMGLSLLLAATVTAGIGLKVEKSTNHTEEYCPLCNIFGLKHQANAINRNINDGATAEHLEDITIVDYNPEHYKRMPLAYPSGSVVIDGQGYINGLKVNPVAPCVPGYQLISVNNDEKYAVYRKADHYDECVMVSLDNGTTRVISKAGVDDISDIMNPKYSPKR